MAVFPLSPFLSHIIAELHSGLREKWGIHPTAIFFNSSTMHFRILSLFFLLTVPPLAAQQIHTNRPNPAVLPLPKSEDAFHFLVFGDRTGGPESGLEVLKQAVADTNLLDPDLVMTVGDLLPGYNNASRWMEDLAKYKTIMQNLKMPWFPVAGNHDIYWRGPDRPVDEHVPLYEKHFGPLWYWFQHKGSAFIVLFSDEGTDNNKPRDFTDPKQQQVSPAQMAWLESTLKETAGLKHAFVFLHHPRWVTETYPASNWDQVHNILKAPGHIRAVFAGHVHRLRFDGDRDGIQYITLGTTGGSMPGHYPNAGYLHHMNLVTVRPDGIKVGIIPVGQVMDPKQFTPDFIAEINKLRDTEFQLTPSPISLDETGIGAGLLEFSITNPAAHPIEVTVVPAGAVKEWVPSTDHLMVKLDPGQTHRGSFSLIRTRRGFEEGFTVPAIEFSVELLLPGLRVPLPPRRITLPVALKSLTESFFTSATNRSLAFNGKQAVRVEMGAKTLPEGPFTVEAWVRPAADGGSGDVVSKAEQSEFALNLAGNVPGFHVMLGGKYESAIATAPVPTNAWTHLAGVYDGKQMTLYVDGQPSATRNASGPRATNPLPLYLGANPDAKSQPTQFYTGSLDEVRLSRTARYTTAFTPAKTHASDADTILLFPCDSLLGPFLPSRTQNVIYGLAELAPTLGDAPFPR